MHAGLSLPDASYGLADSELVQLLGRDVEGAKRLLQQAGVTNLSFEILAPTYLSGTFVTVSTKGIFTWGPGSEVPTKRPKRCRTPTSSGSIW